MLTPAYLGPKFSAGLSYADYLATGNPQQRDSWQKVYAQTRLTDAQTKLLSSFTRQLKVLALSGIWCGDCVQQGPLLARIAEANPQKILLRWFDRDQHADLQDQLSVNGGRRVPVVAFASEDDYLVSWYGDRTLARYRAIAARQLGPSCPLPGAPVDADELAATLADWVDEFERAHLLLRLSTRLRQKHQD
ncbi:MAG: thioredoxin family protein [Phycisphaeraceae bacterium]|nr:thioredoxin family protein [Phycisphaeraceae bacterium]